MCDMVNDAFGYHQHNNDTVDDEEMSACGFQYPIHYTVDSHKPLEWQRVHGDPQCKINRSKILLQQN